MRLGKCTNKWFDTSNIHDKNTCLGAQNGHRKIQENDVRQKITLTLLQMPEIRLNYFGERLPLPLQLHYFKVESFM